MEYMTIVMIITDALIIALSFWILFRLRGYGGLIGESLANVGYGTVILGFSEVFESFNPSWLGMSEVMVETIHHLIFIVGLMYIAIWYKRLMEGK